ncbi:CidA/LrgA family protein [Nocardioides solisilvae]|uniref:CidA/LrgA family protein n=1 Tax=Nocardioides solisilvae TaxID=1542435 RepID=UPI000D74D513|nr:CidA/LrgA family protein [Nocardioides solisilvae]
MLRGLTVLLGCQLVGEVLVRLTALPVPGPVVGMVLLFGFLQLRRTPPDDPASGTLPSASGTLRAADVLLKHLQLFFVPAGVGVVVYLGVLRDDALPIAVALAGSWLAGLLVVGWTVALLGRRAASDDAPGSVS